jgi:hypothetical protein
MAIYNDMKAIESFNGHVVGEPIMQGNDIIREAILAAMRSTIAKVGVEALKQTSMFMSSSKVAVKKAA